MNSPHFQLAEQLENYVTAWAATEWTSAVVEAGFRIESFGQMISASNPIVIAIMPTSVIDDADGQAVGMDQDLITITVLILARLENVKTSTIATLDALSNELRRHLKQFTPTAITVSDAVTETPERRSVNYVAVYDAMELNAEIFASAIECQYALCTGEL